MLPHFSLAELAVLLVVVLVIMGPKRLPEVAASLGKSIRSFKQGLHDAAEDETPSPTAKKLSDRSV